ncbi:MAG TPA: RagB/SusD family nutrient uptake outer membrane protein, partial [Parasegetibacter sp.]
MNFKYIIILISFCGFASCEKFVDIQPKGQLIPSTLSDFRMLMDRVQFINFTGSIGELAADNMYYNDIEFQQLSNTFEKNTYTWNKEIYTPNDQATDWNVPYERIYTANVVLEGLETLTDARDSEKNALKGEALFLRGIALYEVVSLYAKSYDPATADTDLGVPIRTSSDVFEVSQRPVLAATYKQILDDIKMAETLLPPSQEFKTRASKVAAQALLARIYLSMGNYEDALDNALAVLQAQPNLINYNNIDPFNWPKFSENNAEMVYFATVPNFAYSFDFSVPIDEALYLMYDDNDLRKTLFFDVYTPPGATLPTIGFSGNYSGSWNRFTGIATDEIYLIAAECLARDHEFAESLKHLNKLLENRYVQG